MVRDSDFHSRCVPRTLVPWRSSRNSDKSPAVPTIVYAEGGIGLPERESIKDPFTDALCAVTIAEYDILGPATPPKSSGPVDSSTPRS